MEPYPALGFSEDARREEGRDDFLRRRGVLRVESDPAAGARTGRIIQHHGRTSEKRRDEKSK